MLDGDACRTVLENLPHGVCVVDRSRRILFWNDGAEEITGYHRHEVIGRFCQDNLLMHCDENQSVLCGAGCPLANTMLDGRPRDSDVFLRHKDGQRVPVRVRAVPIRDDFGAIIGSAEFFEERASRPLDTPPRRTTDRVPLDVITGLPDRRVTQEAIREAIEEFHATGQPFGVLCIAIDDLERLRSFDGNQAVRPLLYAIGQTVSRSVRPSDTVGRWHDERLVALIASPEAAGLISCAERVQRLVGLTGVPWWGERLTVTVSMGGAMVRMGDTVESLVGRAEETLEAGMAKHGNAILVV